MHHFHLNDQLDTSGFVERSDYLLFAILDEADAYFVDIMKHSDPENLLWVRQNLLKIVHSNWPELTQSRALRGTTGDQLTDNQKKGATQEKYKPCHRFGGTGHHAAWRRNDV